MRWTASLVLGLACAAAAAAHRPAPDDVIAAIGGPAGRAVGVVEVARDPYTPRLLIVRVDARWAGAASDRRRALAEDWLVHWRQAVPDGLVGVVDAAGARPVVNYDARGQARVLPPSTLP